MSPPSKIRVTRLNEAQLTALVAIEGEHASQHHAHGLGEAIARGEREIAALTKRHNVRVVEADEKVAGYVAWRDESPGVAYLEDLLVGTDWQDTAVGEKLLESVKEEARGLKLPYLVTRVLSKAPYAPGLYKKAGFAPVDAAAPDVVQTWKGEQTAGGKALSEEGYAVLWAKI